MVNKMNMSILAEMAVQMVCDIVGCTKEHAVNHLQKEIHITACAMAAKMAADEHRANAA
jgi:hypothetical protein